MLKKLGWDKDLTEAEMAVIQRVNPANPDAVSWSIDLSGGIQRVAMKHGCIHYGNGKARANAFGPAGRRSRCIASRSTRRGPTWSRSIRRCRTHAQFRMPNIGFDVQKAAVEKGIAKQFPIILTSGRLVEYEGGGEETRSNKWLAELQQDMFIEINPADADRARHQGRRLGLGDGRGERVQGADEGAGDRTRRQGRGLVPFHFAGWFQGVDQRAKYPKGADPIVLGESVNTLTTYGYDPVTGMQEPKATLCQISAA